MSKTIQVSRNWYLSVLVVLTLVVVLAGTRLVLRYSGEAEASVLHGLSCEPEFVYRARLSTTGDVVDGDTFDLDIDTGLGGWLLNERVRLHGFDTPEKKDDYARWKRSGEVTREYLQNAQQWGNFYFCSINDSRGSFGRVLISMPGLVEALRSQGLEK